MKEFFDGMATVVMLVISAWVLKLMLEERSGHKKAGGCGCEGKPKTKAVTGLGNVPPSCGLGPKKTIGAMT